MKFVTVVLLNGLLAATAQACTRVLLKEVDKGDGGLDREVKLWDNDMVSELHMTPALAAITIGSMSIDDRQNYEEQGYQVNLEQDNSKGVVGYPNGKSNGLTQENRKETTNNEGNKQTYYCFWDNYECGNYQCNTP